MGRHTASKIRAPNEQAGPPSNRRRRQEWDNYTDMKHQMEESYRRITRREDFQTNTNITLEADATTRALHYTQEFPTQTSGVFFPTVWDLWETQHSIHGRLESGKQEA